MQPNLVFGLSLPVGLAAIILVISVRLCLFVTFPVFAFLSELAFLKFMVRSAFIFGLLFLTGFQGNHWQSKQNTHADKPL